MSVLEDLETLEVKHRRLVWKPFMEKYDCQRVCELGVRGGDNFALMIEHEPELAVGIDIWKAGGSPSTNDMGWEQEKLDTQREEVMARFVDRPFVRIYSEYTHEAVERFPDEHFDFIFIDADHSYEGVKRDIDDWYPKVKKGRFLLGHDFRKKRHSLGFKFGVIEAVTEFAHKNRKSFFVVWPTIWGIVK